MEHAELAFRGFEPVASLYELAGPVLYSTLLSAAREQCLLLRVYCTDGKRAEPSRSRFSRTTYRASMATCAHKTARNMITDYTIGSVHASISHWSQAPTRAFQVL